MSIELKEPIYVDGKQVNLQFFEMEKGKPTVLKFGDAVFVRKDKITSPENNGDNGKKITENKKIAGDSFHVVDIDVVHENTNRKNNNGHEKDNIKSRYKNNLFSEKDVLLSKKDSGYNINIYRPIVDFILENISKEFNRKDLREQIYLFYQKQKWSITRGSAQVYSCDYRKFLLKNNIIRQYGEDDFVVVESNKDVDNVNSEEQKKEVEKKASVEDDKNKDCAPNNTAWFLNWVKNKKFFRVADFLNECHFMEEKQAWAIIRYQIKKNVLTQISNTTFRVNKVAIKNIG